MVLADMTDDARVRLYVSIATAARDLQRTFENVNVLRGVDDHVWKNANNTIQQFQSDLHSARSERSPPDRAPAVPGPSPVNIQVTSCTTVAHNHERVGRLARRRWALETAMILRGTTRGLLEGIAARDEALRTGSHPLAGSNVEVDEMRDK